MGTPDLLCLATTSQCRHAVDVGIDVSLVPPLIGSLRPRQIAVAEPVCQCDTMAEALGTDNLGYAVSKFQDSYCVIDVVM